MPSRPPLPAILRMVVLIGLLTSISGCSSSTANPASSDALTAVAAVDFSRYMGTWLEIAKYPNRFQKQCVADTSAIYSLQIDGTVKVVNRCRRADGEMDEAVGNARQVGPAKLKVRFAPAWLSWLPAVWGNYWIIDIDEGYQLVAVSEPTREYLWILARTPAVDPAAYQALLKRLEIRGFELSKLEISKTIQ